MAFSLFRFFLKKFKWKVFAESNKSQFLFKLKNVI